MSSTRDYNSVPSHGNESEATGGMDSGFPKKKKPSVSSVEQKSFLGSPVSFAVIVMSASALWLAGLNYLGGTLSTIEKRLQLKSSESGLFPVTNDCVGICTLLFIIHFGQPRHRPRIIAVLYSIAGLGFVLHAVPHFVYDLPYSLRVPDYDNGNSTGSAQLCRPTEQGEGEEVMVCSEEQQSESGPLWGEASWILIGQALCSCGTPVYPLFITYVDDGVNNRAMGLYLGALFSTITIGSAMGYGIATLCLNLPSYLTYTDAYLPTSPDDPRWLGNWWLGFLIIGVLLFFVSIPLWFFPRFPRKTFVDEEEEDGDCKNDSSDDYVEAVTQGLKSLESEATHGFLYGLVLSVGRIVSNITVVCLILASTAIAGFIAGFQLFGAKYIQYEFSFDPDFASILFGLLLVPAGILGNIMGGYLVNRFAHERNDMAKMVVTCAAVCLILSPTLLFLGCKNNQVSCLTSLDDKNSTQSPCVPQLTSPCNVQCQCPVIYDPICNEDSQVTYVSPCHAGCTESYTAVVNGRNKTVYRNCACVTHENSALSPTSGSAIQFQYDAVEGECYTNCVLIVPFVIVIVAVLTAGIMCANPVILLEIRSVEPRDRSMTIAVGNFLGKIFGYIPGPLYYGAIIDTACLLFQKSCDETGNCLRYDVVALRHAFSGISVALQYVGIFFIFIAFYSIKYRSG